MLYCTQNLEFLIPCFSVYYMISVYTTLSINRKIPNKKIILIGQFSIEILLLLRIVCKIIVCLPFSLYKIHYIIGMICWSQSLHFNIFLWSVEFIFHVNLFLTYFYCIQHIFLFLSIPILLYLRILLSIIKNVVPRICISFLIT